MQRKNEFNGPSAYLRRGPVVRGRRLIPGRKDYPFPLGLLLEEKPITFREPSGTRTREEREEAILKMLQLARPNRKLVAVMIPNDVYDNPETQIFYAGWTLVRREDEIRTWQCVVFLSGEAFPIGRCDQGVICLALRISLSAWDGRTEEQSRACAA